jgi:hypothetical protein
MNSNKLQIVIARYNEPTEIEGWSWIEYLLDKNYKCFLYSKSTSGINDKIKNHKNSEIEILENKGREAGTYLYHIIMNYDRLPEYTLFLQGNPFEHWIETFEQINDQQHNPRAWKIFFENLDQLSLNGEFTPLNCRFIHDRAGPMKQSSWHPGYRTTYHRNTKRYHDAFKELFEEEMPRTIEFTQGAQFIVSREAIQFREKKFYEKAHELVNHSIKPLEAYIYERIWGIIFNCKTI